MGNGDRSVGFARSSDATFKHFEIVANGHGEGQQLLESLLRLVKLDGNAAGFESHTSRQVLEGLIDDADGGLDQQLRLIDPLLPQGFDEAGHFAAALDFIGAFVAFGDPLESGDEGFPIGEPVNAGTAFQDARRHDLLGASPADAEQELEGGPIHIGKRVLSQGLYNVRQITIPNGFCWHSA